MRQLALDISTTAIGWATAEENAWPGSAKEYTTLDPATFEFGTETADWDNSHSEGEKLFWVFAAVSGLIVGYDPQECVIEESNSSKNMITTRLLMGARGVALFACYRNKVKASMMTCGAARKACGIDMSGMKQWTKYKRRKETKRRVIEWANKQGFETDSDDTADALVLLMAGE